MSNRFSFAESFTTFRRRSYFGALDGLRAISILLVLLHHTADLSAGNRLVTLQENGRYGVGFFFVISGFLICTLFLREEHQTGGINLWKFYGRRTLRLLPLYYAALALQILLVFGLHQYSIENQQLFRDKLPSYLFYFSNLLPNSTQAPFFCSWSLAVEEQFYIIFGLLLFLCNRRLVISVVLAALLVKFAVYQIFGAVDADSALWRVIFSYREPILMGVLAAFLLDEASRHQRVVQLLGPSWVPVALCCLTAFWLFFHRMRHESFWDSQLLYVLMTLTLVSVVIRPHNWGLENPLLRHIGKISYGIYLLHMFVLSSVRKLPGGTDPVMCFALTSMVSIAVAALVYQFFEKPIIDFYKRRLSSTKPLPPNEPTVVPPSPASPVVAPSGGAG